MFKELLLRPTSSDEHLSYARVRLGLVDILGSRLTQRLISKQDMGPLPYGIHLDERGFNKGVDVYYKN